MLAKIVPQDQDTLIEQSLTIRKLLISIFMLILCLQGQEKMH